MDKKLAAYRNKKRKKEMFESAKSKLKDLLFWDRHRFRENPTEAEDREHLNCESKVNDKDNKVDNDDVESTSSDDSSDDSSATSSHPAIRWTLYSLYFSLWLTLYILALRIEFGAIYFILSSFYLIWVNTRTKPKKKGEVSAYSVFNPDCKSIDGTLKAEQFEREIMFGATSIH